MSRKDYFSKNVNFGKKGDVSRIIAESLSERLGKTKFSEEMRRILVIYYSDSELLKSERKKMKIQEYNLTCKESKDIIQRKKKIEEELEKLNVDTTTLYLD